MQGKKAGKTSEFVERLLWKRQRLRDRTLNFQSWTVTSVLPNNPIFLLVFTFSLFICFLFYLELWHKEDFRDPFQYSFQALELHVVRKGEQVVEIG